MYSVAIRNLIPTWKRGHLEGWRFGGQEFVRLLRVDAGGAGGRDEAKHEATTRMGHLVALASRLDCALRLRWPLEKGKASAMSGEDVEATVTRVTGEQGDGYFYLVVATPFGNKAVRVSRKEARHFRPGMNVTIDKRGWGFLSEWWLRR